MMSEDETTTEMLAETEAQAEYAPPEGWRVLAVGEKLQAGDMWVWPNSDEQRPTILVGAFVGSNQRYIRRIEPQSKPQPQPEPQPVQVRKGRWRTRGGQVYYVTPSPEDDPRRGQFPWRNASDGLTWREDGRWVDHEESMFDLIKYLGPFEQPEKIITPDDVAAEALAEPQPVHLQAMIESLTETIAQSNSEMHSLNMEIGGLQSQLEAVKAESAKRLETIQELRSEVSQVHRQWGDSRWRVEELEQKLAEAQPQPVHQQAMIDAQAETIARLHSEINELHIDIISLETQLEAVKAELSQVSRDRYLLQIELDAREQVPQAVGDRFEEGWDAGTARAVETIAEWTAPFRTCGSQGLALAIMQNLPHIMRSLTGLTDED